EQVPGILGAEGRARSGLRAWIDQGAVHRDTSPAGLLGDLDGDHAPGGSRPHYHQLQRITTACTDHLRLDLRRDSPPIWWSIWSLPCCNREQQSTFKAELTKRHPRPDRP